MTVFNLPNQHCIRKFDDKNWVLEKTHTVKKGKTAGLEQQVIVGYYPKLKGAWNAAVDHLALDVDTNKELRDVLDKMEQIKE